ncbi:hypothetical protein TNCV_1377961 [Trichonephila clavipes]|nr:hypothetical protein TNCV_1377961 [Trichonephila clavipes]
MVPNLTENFSRVIVGSLEMTNQHRIWGPKPCLVGENRDYSSRSSKEYTKRGEWLNECVDMERREKNLSASSNSNYDGALSPIFLPHPSERNAINIIQHSDKSTDDFDVVYYTDGRVGFGFVVFRS